MGPSNRQGASMRSLRKAQGKSRSSSGHAELCRRAAGLSAPSRAGGSCWFSSTACPREGGGLVDEHQSPGIDKALIGPPTRAMAAYVRAVLLARDKRLFLNVTPRRRKKRLIIEVSDLTPRSHKRESHSAESVMSVFSVRAAFEKITVRHQLGRPVAAVPDRLSRAMAFNAFKPLDRHGFADLVAPRRRAPAHPAPLHRVNHPITQVLRIRLRHSCWPPRKPTG